jgi:hypothetical protein
MASTDTINRQQALLVARAQSDIHNAAESLTAIADELGEIVRAVEGAPTDRADETQRAFWEPFYDEADAEAEAVTA